LVGFARKPMIEKFRPELKDVVYSVPFGSILVALKDTIELEVKLAIIHGKDFGSLVGVEHSNELLMRLHDFFLVQGRRL
jgi:hypothetical protein